MTSDTCNVLRSPRDVVDAGLAPAQSLPELEAMAARCAIAITPAMADLTEPSLPAVPIARPDVSPARLARR